MTTVVRPVRAPTQPITATYAPRMSEPVRMTSTRSSKANAGPSVAPASIVGVNTVKPSSTTAIEKNDLRACAGTGVTG